jgi:hypothetical protein
MFFHAAIRRAVLSTILLIVCAAAAIADVDGGVTAFATDWTGRRVIVRSALYTVLYDEVGRAGIHYRGKLAGLTVATPMRQEYEFEGPGSGGKIVAAMPDRVVSEMSVRFFRANHLDIGNVQTITPLVLRQYEPGVVLIVAAVKVERSRVRLDFRQEDHEEPFATSLTVKWALPFSNTVAERRAIETVVRRFVTPQ